ncbi:MAG: trypsin-like peptidase domain-containing protein [Candidatus Giovannonibacteria bacterium]|nr:MAG: trypsin-like peptidase domain-containing protein [Candidatus Giovannonibacteria bacterium]
MKKLSFVVSFLLLTAVFVAPLSVSAAQSTGIKPGSFLYGFVTTFEKINLFFTFNPEKKAEKALKYAEKRLTEAEAVAGDKNSDAVKTAISGYEANIALAAEASKKVKDETKAESLLNLIANNTSKHQEILADVLSKVPDEAKEAITKALEASKKGQEEALNKIAELNKSEGGGSEMGSNEVNLTKKELDELRNLLLQERKKREELENKIQSQSTAGAKTTQQNSQESGNFILSTGVVVDRYGNIISIPKSEDKIKTENGVLTVTEIANRIIPAITRIKTFTTDSESVGSGVTIESDGLILTAAHVVKGFDSVQVYLSNGETHIGKIIGRDEFNDMALVRISKNNLPIVVFGDSDHIMIGDKVLVFGHPLDLPSAVLSTGIIGGKQPGNNFTFLQTDAKTQPGSSGGGWVSEHGKLIGLHVAGIGPKIQGIKIDVGLNFAVPINFIKSIIPKLKQGENKIDYQGQPAPPVGSEVQIRTDVKVRVDLNPSLSCSMLGFTDKDLFACNLYRSFPKNYVWVEVNEYTDNINQAISDKVLSNFLPTFGSTITIKRSTIFSSDFNPELQCAQLGLDALELDKCKLYRTKKDSYNWQVID